MEITGKIIAVLPERSGVSASGNQWKSISYVLETMEQYPKRMCFDVFGADKLQQFAIQTGEIITVSFDIDAREYQGKWFNSIRAWKVIRPGNQAYSPTSVQTTTPPPYPNASNTQPPFGSTPNQQASASSSFGHDPGLPFPPPTN